MKYLRLFLTALLLFLAFSSVATSQKASRKGVRKAECTGKEPFAYDNGPVGQGTWCGFCNDADATIQAPINIPSNIPSSTLPPIEFQNYDHPIELNTYADNPYNLKVNTSAGTASIKIGTDVFNLIEFHFHRPSEEALGNRRYPMVVHLVHKKPSCQIGDAGCVAVVTVLIEQGNPADKTSALLKTLFDHFPPPAGPHPGVTIRVDGLLPTDYPNASYYRYDGSLTTPPCTGNITFYVLKPLLSFSEGQIAEFARRYPSPNSRDIQPLNGRDIKFRVP